jgi:hypothetical protein
MEQWLADSEVVLNEMKSGFGVFVDMRTLKLISPGVQEAFERGQRLYKRMGMARSVVIVENTTLAIQFKRIALQSDIYDWERYIDATAFSDWQRLGEAWIAEGIDPDADRRMRIAGKLKQSNTPY